MSSTFLDGNMDASKCAQVWDEPIHRGCRIHTHTNSRRWCFSRDSSIKWVSKCAVRPHAPSFITGSCTEPLPHCPIRLKHLLNPHLSSHMCTHKDCSFSLSPTSHTHTHTPTLSDGSFLPIQQNSLDAVVMSLPWTKEIRWPYWDPIDMHTLSYTHTQFIYQSQSMCFSAVGGK